MQNELNEKKDLDAENSTLKQQNDDLAKENQRLKMEIDRMRKMLINAESRADENEHKLKKSLKRAPDVLTPLDALPSSQSSFNNGAMFVSSPKTRKRLPPAIRTPTRSKHIEPDASPYVSVFESPNPTQLPLKKRGVILDYTVKRERLDFKYVLFNFFSSIIIKTCIFQNPYFIWK